MTQYNSLNVNLSNSQLNRIKSAIENERGIVLKLSLNIVGDDETNFSHKLLLTNREVESLRKALANKSSKLYQKLNYLWWYNQENFLLNFLVHYYKTGLPLIKIVIKPLAKSALIPSGLTGARSAADGGIH